MTPQLFEANQISTIASQLKEGQIKGFLIFASSKYCPWCGLVLREQLLPRLRARDLPPIAIVEFDINNSRSLAISRDNPTGVFELSANLSPSTWATSHKIRVVPTLTAVDQRLSPLLPALVGYSSADFYGAYLEEQIGESIRYWATVR
jgi:hypothetical protein